MQINMYEERNWKNEQKQISQTGCRFKKAEA